MSRSLIHRRRMLRGMLGGTVVSVGLPLLDALLNSNGDALADTSSGGPKKGLPLCFGGWFWPLGLSHGAFTVGAHSTAEEVTRARQLASDQDALWVPRKT